MRRRGEGKEELIVLKMNPQGKKSGREKGENLESLKLLINLNHLFREIIGPAPS